ncbi:ribonuclease Oy-like [Glandiceps talaboti]
MCVNMEPLYKIALWLFFVILLSSSSFSHSLRYRSDDEWDHFVYAQQWPQTSCNSANWQKEHNCSVPSKVKTWTVHGLWPSKGNTEGPNNCNASWPFDPDKIKDIEPELETFWPNLYTDSKRDDFWTHEWDKHGTCGVDLEAIDSELKYFKTGLKLNQDVNLTKSLSDHGIVPSLDKSYSYDDVMNAFTDTFGFAPMMNCYYNKTTKTSYLEQVSFCLTKSFKVFDCKTAPHSSYQSDEACWTNESVIIPPIIHSSRKWPVVRMTNR